jgi:cholest-4-en-3-one 26-monooxygenase
VNGAALGPVELLSYYLLLVVAGNETTRNAMTGGMLALLEHPGEWQKLRATPRPRSRRRGGGALGDPGDPVLPHAAARPHPARQAIRAGRERLPALPSANRDEEVFEDPDVFRVDRHPNRHIAFGVGEHVCLGAHLARLELRCAFAALRERLVHAELSGPIERARSSFVGGIKRAPMRWRIRPA